MWLRVFLVSVATLVGGAGCSGSSTSASDAGAPAADNAGNGVDDVKAACVIRGGWTQSSSSACTDCILYAPVAPCSCSSDPNLGKCESQSVAAKSESDCTDAIAVCVTDCLSDCSCVDACYDGHDACRTVTAALDGCLAAACNAVCK
jgi:hypothetical protein